MTPDEEDPSYDGHVNMIDAESEDVSDPKNMKMKITRGMQKAYEEALKDFLLDMKTNQTYQMGDYYGDPELALIDKHGAFVVVIGSDHLGVFDLVNKELQIMDIHIPDWIISLNQEGRKIEVIYEK